MRAVKIINKKNLEEEEKEKLLNEIQILKQMDHPNILKLYEFYQDDKRYFLVTEYYFYDFIYSLGFAMVESSLIRSLRSSTSAREMEPTLLSKCFQP